jgi:hypothetical protein
MRCGNWVGQGAFYLDFFAIAITFHSGSDKSSDNLMSFLGIGHAERSEASLSGVS